MTITKEILTLAVLAGSLPGQQSQTASQGSSTLHVEARLVNVPFSVQDHDGKIVAGLTRDDFEILDNGRPQTISHFAEDDSAPLTFELLLSAWAGPCGCLHQYLSAEKQGIEVIVANLRPADTALLASFGDGGLRLWQDVTASSTDLLSALDRIEPARRAGRTDLFDAVYLLATKRQSRQPGRKIMLILSDAVDYSPNSRFSRAVKAAKEAETVIFGFRYLDDSTLNCFLDMWPEGQAKRAYSEWDNMGRFNLQLLAQPTAGRVFGMGAKTSLDSFLPEAIGQARHQYAIGYPPPEAGKQGAFHRIEIRCRTPKVKVMARSGYFEDRS